MTMTSTTRLQPSVYEDAARHLIGAITVFSSFHFSFITCLFAKIFEFVSSDKQSNEIESAKQKGVDE